jgi:hypothetical protein
MNAQQAYEWLAPKLSTDERKALDVVYAAAGAMQQAHPAGFISKSDLECLGQDGRAMVWRSPSGDSIPLFAGQQ